MSKTNSKSSVELIRAVFSGDTNERTPWVPFVGAHGGALLQVPADEYLRSSDRMVEGIEAAIARYKPDGLPIGFDLQVEAEALGCQLKWAAENPPAVIDHPLEDGTAVEDLRVPGPDEGRIPVFLDAARRVRTVHPEIALFGLVTGPFTLALHLLGTNIFMQMFDAPDRIQRLLEFTRDVGLAMSRYYLEAGCDAVAVVDPMTSQIGPDQFNEFVTPFVSPIFSTIRDLGGLTSFFVCGHAQQNLSAMCECRPQNVCVDENIPLDYVRDICRSNSISFGGNLQLTTVLLLGTPEDAERNAVECLEIGENRGFVLAPGCDIPYATPPENLEAIGRLIHDPYRQEAVHALATSRDMTDILDMSEYGHADKVIVDIITLDSEACTPCQYMVEAVRQVAPEFEGIVEWREHKIKKAESLVFMTSLLVKNIPTICIDGQITFVSRIPPQNELIAAIQQRINEKMRTRIRQRHASIFVLGTDETEYQPLLESVQRAVLELGADVRVSLVTNEEEIQSFGVHPALTPAVVTAKYQIKSTCRLPDPQVIKEWIKMLD